MQTDGMEGVAWEPDTTFKEREASTGTVVWAELETVWGCGLTLGAEPAGSRRGHRPRDPRSKAWDGSGPRTGGGLWPVSHPLVDGVCLAQRALCCRDAVGDAPVALAQTPQLAADLLRPRCPLKLALLPQEDPGSLPAGQWGPGSQGIFLDTVAGYGPVPPLCLHMHCTY